jgi:hypothetical protein
MGIVYSIQSNCYTGFAFNGQAHKCEQRGKVLSEFGVLLTGDVQFVGMSPQVKVAARILPTTVSAINSKSVHCKDTIPKLETNIPRK